MLLLSQFKTSLSYLHLWSHLNNIPFIKAPNCVFSMLYYEFMSIFFTFLKVRQVQNAVLQNNMVLHSQYLMCCMCIRDWKWIICQEHICVVDELIAWMIENQCLSFQCMCVSSFLMTQCFSHLLKKFIVFFYWNAYCPKVVISVSVVLLLIVSCVMLLFCCFHTIRCLMCFPSTWLSVQSCYIVCKTTLEWVL